MGQLVIVLPGNTPSSSVSNVLYTLTYLPAGLCVAQPCRYCFYSVVQKWVFRPTGATRCPDKREIWHGGADPRSAPPCWGPLPRAKFHVYRGKNVGIQPPKLSQFRILVRNLYFRGDSFAIFLRNSQHLYASIDSFYVFSLVTFEGQTPKL